MDSAFVVMYYLAAQLRHNHFYVSHSLKKKKELSE